MGGAHRDPELMAKTLRKNLTDRMKYLRRFTPEKLIARRLNRIMRYGEYETVTAAEAEKIRAEAIAARRTPRKRSLRSPARRKRPARQQLKRRRRKRPIKHVPR